MIDCVICFDGQFCRCVIRLRLNPELRINPCGSCVGFIGCPRCGLTKSGEKVPPVEINLELNGAPNE